MKTLYLNLVFLALPALGFSQPVINDVFPDVGDNLTYIQYDFSEENLGNAPDTGSAGPDQTWMFSGLGTEDYQLEYNVEASQDMEGSANFPESTIGFEVNLIGLGTINFFLDFENGYFTEHGSYFSDGGFSSLTVYTDPLDRIPATLSYLDSGSDNFEAVQEGIQDYNLSGTTTYVVDGYGSLSTDLFEYDNVLRVRSEEVQEQELSGGFTLVSNTIDFQYYIEDFPMPVLIVSHFQSTFFGEIDEESVTVNVLTSYDGIALSTGEYNVDESVTIFPNPASDQIQVQSTSRNPQEIRIYSMDGKLVLTDLLQEGQYFSVSQLPQGYYIAELRSRESIIGRKSLVISR